MAKMLTRVVIMHARILISAVFALLIVIGSSDGLLPLSATESLDPGFPCEGILLWGEDEPLPVEPGVMSPED
jgi:hypothetical protein